MGSEVKKIQKNKHRTIFIGDVHGCIEELEILVAKLKLTPSSRVILLGDLVNKGPYSIECIKYVYQQGFDCLMGNNDAYYLQFKNTLLKDALSKAEHHWFKSLPLYFDESRFIAVHAGLHPHYSLKNTPKKILISIREYQNKPWYHYYQGNRLVIYGHWAKQGLVTYPAKNPKVIGLDSGCVYGKELTAYVLETREFVKVKAKQIYQRI